MRILYAALVEPPDVETLLQLKGFNVYSTDDADEVVSLATLYDYDLIVLGDINGAQRVLTTLRASKCKTPILRLSGLAASPTATEEAVRALDAGADDCMLTSDLVVGADELIARIHAIVRRSKGHPSSAVQVGTLSLNLSTRTVTVAGAKVHLTGKEYAMLELLALRKGHCVSKEQFLSNLYGGMDEPEMKIIDVFICKLRKKIGPGIVETVWGRGYVLAGEEGAGTAEVRDMLEEPPVFVARRTTQEAEAVGAKKRFGGHKEATLVPDLPGAGK